LRDPSSPLAVLPLSLALRAVCLRVEDAHSVLHVVLPLSDVLVAVREDHGSLAVFLASFEVSLVATAIFKGQFANTLENVACKLPLVGLLALSKVVDA